MIEFQKVALAYHGRTILGGIDLRLQFHERLAIVGGSGSGKTTLLKLLLGLIRPDAGRIVIDGQDIAAMTEAQLRRPRLNFNIVFQEGALFDSMNVRENAAFCLRERFNFSEAEIEARVRRVLRRLGIEDAIDLMPEQLSGGMQRRVAIARSLMECEPRMFLYDEPTTGLDPLTADSICNLIRELSAGEPPDNKGLVIVTHQVADVIGLVERWIFLYESGIRFDGTTARLKRMEDPLIRSFFRQIWL
jgi:phospholipid/cholesterol/gamma-HCH transport system ATP-binding protein